MDKKGKVIFKKIDSHFTKYCNAKTTMMSTTMGYTCGCGSVLRYKTKTNMKAHLATKKHHKWLYRNDIRYRGDYREIHNVDLKVEYATTYGRATIENYINLYEATWEQLEEEIARRVKLAKTKYEYEQKEKNKIKRC